MPADSLAVVDKAAVARRFNRSAVTYDAHCRIQRRMAGRLMARIQAAPGRILELGCGTGYLTDLLAGSFPAAEILAVDFAGRMIEIARQRLPGDRVEFLVADAEKTDFGADCYDLIVSNATIQWFEAPGQTIAALAASLRPGGRMLHSTFGPATFSELKSVLGGPGGDDGPAGLPLRSARQWAALLAEGGLEQVESHGRSEVVQYQTGTDFLRELQATGVTWRPHGVGTGPIPPQAMRRALARYEARFGSRDGVPVTYELVEVCGALRETRLMGERKVG